MKVKRFKESYGWLKSYRLSVSYHSIQEQKFYFIGVNKIGRKRVLDCITNESIVSMTYGEFRHFRIKQFPTIHRPRRSLFRHLTPTNKELEG